MKDVHLQHFSKTEFREWWGKMSPRLLVLLDILRYKLKSPIQISRHPKSLGRHLGDKSHSEHNIDFWLQVLAVDCFVTNVFTRNEAAHVVYTAHGIGFTGIGVYPDWINGRGDKQVGFHLGVRPTINMGNPAEWGYVDTKQVALEVALREVGR